MRRRTDSAAQKQRREVICAHGAGAQLTSVSAVADDRSVSALSSRLFESTDHAHATRVLLGVTEADTTVTWSGLTVASSVETVTSSTGETESSTLVCASVLVRESLMTCVR